METTPTTNRESDHQFRQLLGDLAGFPPLHARLINTLSMLEYIGSRKILKSQRAESIHLEILSHVAEEIRHAQVLKKIALKMSEQALTTYAAEHLLAGSEACRYFKTIDQAAAVALGSPDPWTNYLLTTLLIEERANSIYPYYEDILAKAGFPGYLKAIVREESNHLNDICIRIRQDNQLTESMLNQLREVEDAAFMLFTEALQANFSALAS